MALGQILKVYSQTYVDGFRYVSVITSMAHGRDGPRDGVRDGKHLVFPTNFPAVPRRGRMCDGTVTSSAVSLKRYVRSPYERTCGRTILTIVYPVRQKVVVAPLRTDELEICNYSAPCKIQDDTTRYE